MWYWYFIGVVWGLSAIWLAWKLITAPAGYEDETGFHYGEAK